MQLYCQGNQGLSSLDQNRHVLQKIKLKIKLSDEYGVRLKDFFSRMQISQGYESWVHWIPLQGETIHQGASSLNFWAYVKKLASVHSVLHRVCPCELSGCQ